MTINRFELTELEKRVLEALNASRGFVKANQIARRVGANITIIEQILDKLESKDFIISTSTKRMKSSHEIVLEMCKKGIVRYLYKNIEKEYRIRIK